MYMPAVPSKLGESDGQVSDPEYDSVDDGDDYLHQDGEIGGKFFAWAGQ